MLAARREEPLAAAAAELGATAVRCDVTDDGDVAALVAAAQAAGGCDLLVHSAGAPARAGVLDADLAAYRTVVRGQLHRARARGHGVLAAARGEPRPARAGRLRGRHGRARALGAVRVGQERRAVVGALLRRRRARARRGGHDRQPRARADAGLPAGCAPAQPLGAADHGRRRALRRAPAGGRRPPRARGLRAAVVARSPRRLQGAAPALTARVAARAWRATQSARRGPRPRPREPSPSRSITGGSSGIGLGIARRLLERELPGRAHARAGEDRLDRLVEELGVTGVAADVSTEEGRAAHRRRGAAARPARLARQQRRHRRRHRRPRRRRRARPARARDRTSTRTSR